MDDPRLGSLRVTLQELPLPFSSARRQEICRESFSPCETQFRAHILPLCMDSRLWAGLGSVEVVVCSPYDQHRITSLQSTKRLSKLWPPQCFMKEKIELSQKFPSYLEGNIPTSLQKTLKPIPASSPHAGVLLLLSWLNLQSKHSFQPESMHAFKSLYVCVSRKRRLDTDMLYVESQYHKLHWSCWFFNKQNNDREIKSFP